MTSETTPTSSVRADLALVVVAFFWGFTFVVVKAALRDSSTYVFLGIRFAIASSLLWLILRFRPGALHGFFRAWREGLLCGGLLFLGYVTQTLGLLTTTPSKSAFLTGLYIVLVPVCAALLDRRWPRWTEWLSALAATAGTALLTVNPAEPLRFTPGDLLTIACAVLYAFYMLAVARYSSARNHSVLALWQIVVVAVFSFICVPWAEPLRLSWTPRLIGALLATAVFATTVSFLLYTWAQARTSALRAALVLALEPVFAGLTGWLLAGDRWTPAWLGGAALILAAIVLVDLKPTPGGAHPHE
jgi:drug/metabolite transporter (DMT)-like permease